MNQLRSSIQEYVRGSIQDHPVFINIGSINQGIIRLFF